MKTPLSRKLCSADQAVEHIRDCMTVACGGFVGAGHPEAITAALERRFHSQKQPRDLTLFFAAAQVDQHGYVNVSPFGSRFAGVGGFVNISQNARRLVFCGTMTTDGLEVQYENGIVRIVSEGG